MDVQLLTVPYDSGARGIHMGAGPGRLLDMGLAEHLGAGGHQVHIGTVEIPASPIQAEIATAFALSRALSGRVRDAVRAERLPLVLTGNCFAALGAVAGLDAATGVFWFDAHGDFNTPETTTGGFLDGMALAIVTGRCWRRLARNVAGFTPVPEEDVLLLGVRDLDPPEAALLEESDVRVLSPGEVSGSLPELADEISSRVRQGYLHLDLDVVDPRDGRANRFAAPDGIPLAPLENVLSDLARRVPLGAVTLSAYDPEADEDDRAGTAALRLLRAVVDGVASGRG